MSYAKDRCPINGNLKALYPKRCEICAKREGCVPIRLPECTPLPSDASRASSREQERR
jgi:hypothetical protein